MIVVAMTIASAMATPAVAAERIADGTWEIAGGIRPGMQPDGNSYVLRGPQGLVVIDTGRHAFHREKIEAFARGMHRPIVAIVNTHWHLDHVSGNVGLRKAWPDVRVYASSAIDDALDGFLAKGATATRRALAEGQFDARTAAEAQIDLDTVDAGAALKPDVVVDADRTLVAVGRALDVHVARDAATAADVWIFDAASRIAFVGDLVTFPAAFLDTACIDGWVAALDAVAATPFDRVAPGHGPLLTRAGFLRYRNAFVALAACSAAGGPADSCADGWAEAVETIGDFDARERARAHSMTVSYVAEVLRPNGGDSRYCRTRSAS